MRKIQSVLIMTLAILILSASTGWARVYIDITKPFTRKLPLAMPSFSPLPGAGVNKLAAEGARILISDLDFTGLFEMIDKGAYLERVTGEKITYKAWSRVGAELLITGFYRISGASMTLNMRLYDITEQKQLIGKQYNGLPVDLPQIMHRFADEVMMVVTGERSVFSSQIAFVGARQGRSGRGQGNLPHELRRQRP
jgi:TolB protein